MQKVLLTGATGVMGQEGLKNLVNNPDLSIRVLARPSKKNKRKLQPFIDKGVEVVWGDLTDPEDVRKAAEGIDIILHVGGMVSPMADWFPRKTIEVNVTSMKNIIAALDSLGQKDSTAVVYIGSVAQYGYYSMDNPWGGIGDPLRASLFDAYAYSKIEAERLLTESGIRRWVSLRQSGILHKGLLSKTDDPIMFHVPLRGVLEWATVEDSGRLLERVCDPGIPDEFWNNFYNISSGPSFRLSNYEFEVKLLKAIGCPPPEKIFEADWFATANFHGMWYRDSWRLEDYLHFRNNMDVDDYFDYMASLLPPYFKLSFLAPSFLIKRWMRYVAHKPQLGTLWWLDNDSNDHISAAFGSREEWTAIPDWRHQPTLIPTPEMKEIPEDIRLQSFPNEKLPGDPDILEDLICENGHPYRLTPRARILGGHGCPICAYSRTRLD